jgi:hypothetical protein
MMLKLPNGDASEAAEGVPIPAPSAEAQAGAPA